MAFRFLHYSFQFLDILIALYLFHSHWSQNLKLLFSLVVDTVDTVRLTLFSDWLKLLTCSLINLLKNFGYYHLILYIWFKLPTKIKLHYFCTTFDVIFSFFRGFLSHPLIFLILWRHRNQKWHKSYAIWCSSNFL